MYLKKIIITIIFFKSILFAGNFSAQVIPDTSFVSQYGSWEVKCRIGSKNIQTGGRIKIQFPNCWHTSPWPEGKLKNEQISDPTANHYIGINIPKKDCKGQVSIVRKGIDGQHDRFGRSFLITIKKGHLSEGDYISLYFKNTTSPIISEVQIIAMAIDFNGSGNYKLIKNNPSLTLLAETPEKLQVIAPSQAQTGQPVNIGVIILDQFYNPAKQYQGSLKINSSDKKAKLPKVLKFTPTDNGIKTIPITFKSQGIQTIQVQGDQLLSPHGIKSNPVRVNKKTNRYNIYWGDLHSHCNNSKDGYGKPETAFNYAREVARLDFYALTDHGAGDRHESKFWEGLTTEEWKYNIDLVKKYYNPEKFVPFLACEWSGRAPYGHHNVIYRNDYGTIFGEDKYKSIEQVWKSLDNKQAVTIPHHTGISWPNGIGPYTNWQRNINNNFRTAIEIYSLWGSNEYYKSSMAYENYHQRNFSSGKGPYYARDAWSNGHYIGVVAGSDDHNSHPGREYGGLTAVYCNKLDRDNLFNALLNRHTYATTGQRILLRFRINNNIMGSRIQVAPQSNLKMEIEVIGTDDIKYVQVIQYDGYAWTVLNEFHPDGRQFTGEFTIKQINGDRIYYVRLQQKNNIGNRKVMAWSSPIWITTYSEPF